MIRIDDRIWSVWQGLVDDGTEPSVLMRFSTSSDRATAVRAVRDSVVEILRSRYAQLDESKEQDSPRPGEWDWLGVPGGVLVIVSDCEPFEEIMHELAAAIERRGADGTFHLHDWPPPPSPQPPAHVLLCHLRVRGRRLRFEGADGPVFGWEPNSEAHDAILTAAERWCKQLGERRLRGLQVDDRARRVRLP